MADVSAVPSVDEVRPGIWSIPLPLEESSVPYTLSYLVVDELGNGHLIDPGSDTEESWQVLLAALAEAGCSLGRVATVVVTHLHFDHLGMAERIRRSSGARITMHRLEQDAIDQRYGTVPPDRMERWGVPLERRAELTRVARERSSRPHVRADVLVDDGEAIAIPGHDIRVIWTPGHTYGHICLRDAGNGLLFTGDHVLPMIYPGLGLGGPTPTNPIADYLRALERVALYDADEVFPGHGYRFRGLAERCAVTAAHHRNRTANVAAALDRLRSPTVWQVAASVSWSAGWNGLHDYRLDSALAQTSMHIDFLGRAGELSVPAS